MSVNEKSPNGENNRSGLGKKDKGAGVARSRHSRAGGEWTQCLVNPHTVKNDPQPADSVTETNGCVSWE